jgi:hypothetical protein
MRLLFRAVLLAGVCMLGLTAGCKKKADSPSGPPEEGPAKVMGGGGKKKIEQPPPPPPPPP